MESGNKTVSQNNASFDTEMYHGMLAPKQDCFDGMNYLVRLDI